MRYERVAVPSTAFVRSHYLPGVRGCPVDRAASARRRRCGNLIATINDGRRAEATCKVGGDLCPAACAGEGT